MGQRIIRPLGYLIIGSAIAGCSAADPAAETASEPLAQSPQTIEAGSPISIDGSSTVYPISDEMAKQFQFEYPDAPPIAVSFSGTGGGFEKFCAGATDISDASRPISAAEIEACKASGVKFIELPVAFDAITVVTHPDNTWAEEITLAELKTLWSGSVSQWNQLRPDWPAEPVALYGPGEDSGTFDYFNEVVLDGADSRSDYTASEDDNELVEGVKQDPNALGYFGFAYYKDNQDSLNALAVDSGEGPVAPSGETIRSADYQPLARPLFIYVNADRVSENPTLQAFVEYYLANARTRVPAIGYEPLPNAAYAIALDHLQTQKVGSVFAGKAQPNLTIEQLLEKEAAF
ncbi:MAG: PstS family phosphate ABC transporter substrate-binding protein [Leptolyngbya sp. SIO4C1]|nr:PstS family phosphate ABC transporter substrate-binding protein [Leptolyngbya sp. SIO4C1]